LQCFLTTRRAGELGNIFDPYGSAGSSSSKAYKVTLGESDTDLALMRGWELSILGGPGLPPMRAGGRRIVRIPPALAYGAEGHLCKRGVLTACEVPPNTAVQIETVLIGRAF
jgi:peptidylprolyl isomerase